jgi:hypothetical protein
VILLEPNAPPVERFIVEIRDGIPLPVAFEAIRLVVEDGRISETNGKAHHCHVTGFSRNKEKFNVACIPNEKSERFIIYKP